MIKKREKIKDIGPNTYVLIFSIIMGVFGLLMIFNASFYTANHDFGDQFHFVKLQAIWIVLGLIAGIIAYFFNYKRLVVIALPALIAVIILLLLILFLGNDINGSKRWFSIGGIPLQPAELLKPIFIIYLSAWLSKQQSSKNKFSDFRELIHTDFAKKIITFLIILAVVLLLVLLEPDLGTTIIIGITSISLFYISGTDTIHKMGSIGIGFVFTIVGGLAGVLASYRFKRIATFFQTLLTGEVPDKNQSGYQMHQILVGIGSGGFWGKGFAQSRQRYGYLVENTSFTDSIFAVYLEEFGFIGGVFFVIFWLIFLWNGLNISLKAPDKFGQLLAAGITIWLVAQALLNISANVGLVPLTGIPLPFMTYGGSNTIVTFLGIGILLNISKFNHAGR